MKKNPSLILTDMSKYNFMIILNINKPLILNTCLNEPDVHASNAFGSGNPGI